jgi:toxin-antitoxin system PIN domain toxin
VRFLLDANVLIAITNDQHTAHVRAMEWFQGSGGLFATCPITQGALIRYILRAKAGTTAGHAKQVVAGVEALEGHEFWPDSVSFAELPETGVFGYRQVTDAYLVLLARHNKGRLATLDRALSALHAPDAVLIA